VGARPRVRQVIGKGMPKFGESPLPAYLVLGYHPLGTNYGYDHFRAHRILASQVGLFRAQHFECSGRIEVAKIQPGLEPSVLKLIPLRQPHCFIEQFACHAGVAHLDSMINIGVAVRRIPLDHSRRIAGWSPKRKLDQQD
ncbi:MAG: hypothetical protein ACREMY_25700, partial [bacterium]